MAQQSPSILLLGATGLLGTHLLPTLQKTHPHNPVTLYIRQNEPALNTYLLAHGATRIEHGDFAESSRITSLAAEHDIVINSASSWDVDLTKAVIAGLEKRADSSKGVSKPVLIHISGAGNFLDGGWTTDQEKGQGPGAWRGDKIRVWRDDSERDTRDINAQMFNGRCDVEVLKAGVTNKITTYLIIAGGVYGPALGPVPAIGVFQRLVSQKATELGFVPYVGAGETVFATIHVKDVADFVPKIVSLALTGKNDNAESNPYQRVYHLSTATEKWKDISGAFAKALYKKGVVSTPEAKSVELQVAGEGGLGSIMAGSVLMRGPRAVSVGFDAPGGEGWDGVAGGKKGQGVVQHIAGVVEGWKA